MTEIKWITTKQIQTIAKCGRSKAQEIKRKTNDQIIQNGGVLVDRKKTPEHLVLKLLGLSEEGET